MHPSQASIFRKTIIALLSIAFAGTLLVFTAQANLELLKSVYPNPQFYMFGLLALEGGVIYWTGYYLLQLSGHHKAIAVFTLAVDSLLSGIGFFYEMEKMTNKVGTVSLPPIIIIVAFSVIFNVAMSLISHLIPTHNNHVPISDEGYRAPTGERGPGVLSGVAAGLLAKGQDIQELAQQKRAERKALQQQPEVNVVEEATSANPLPVAKTLPKMRKKVN